MIVAVMETPASLIDRLRQCADLWVAAKGGSPAMLGRLVVNDGGYFSRIESNASTTTATLEKFARFLVDGENWPEGLVPDAVHAFAHVVGITPADDSASRGKTDKISPQNSASREAVLRAGEGGGAPKSPPAGSRRPVVSATAP